MIVASQRRSSPPSNKRMATLVDRVDLAALIIVQPAVAGLAILGLWTDSAEATRVTQPLFIWGGVLLLMVVFTESIWSFAPRHSQRRRLGLLWTKMLGSAVCTILAFASAYKHLGVLDGGVISHNPATALYFSVTAWTTVGYGDVVASLPARSFAAAQALIGLIYNSALIGLIIYALTNNRGRGTAASSGDHLAEINHDPDEQRALGK
ncbi:MAG: two pore domain potassium channel family protein [Gammaproteobacteria bacterium]|nr:two pore domain potassium channel family protein [Gammaproteobacteria bacterium]